MTSTALDTPPLPPAPATPSQTTIVTGGHAGVLHGIARGDVGLAIHRRAPLPAADLPTDAELDAIADIRLHCLPDEAERAATGALAAAGYPARSVAAVAPDIAALARQHGAITGAERVTLRLEVVTTDACKRFHADYVTWRTICTYRGPGTQWHRLGEDHAVQEIAPGSVAIFAGRLGMAEPGIRHRSPPIGGTGIRRLVLAIDAASPA